MKKIIDGLRYDTEKAVEIGSYDTGLGNRDFRNWSATLYRTPRSNRYFLAGSGGPMTRFARSVGNMSSGGDGLFPMTAQEALEWAEQYLDADAIEQHFGDAIQDA
jgi:hypothetical protein